MIIIQSNYTDAEAELDRLLSMPTIDMAAGLDAVLDIGFSQAASIVDVITGRLKGSGKKVTKKTSTTWEGRFSFDAVNKKGEPYGAYERERGGHHDFLRLTPLLKPLLKIALVNGLRKK